MAQRNANTPQESPSAPAAMAKGTRARRKKNGRRQPGSQAPQKSSMDAERITETYYRSSYMVETNGGGRLEAVPGFIPHALWLKDATEAVSQAGFVTVPSE